MAIFPAQISDSYLRNKDLSLKARGLIATLLNSTDRSLTVQDLIRWVADSDTSIRSGIVELETRGYFRRDQRGVRAMDLYLIEPSPAAVVPS